MISDSVRMSKYEQAISKVVKSTDHVVDIGAGLGPLALMASKRTKNKVVAVEYIKELADLARTLLDPNEIDVLNTRSYDVNLKNIPDVIVTETIGPIGPEENIVELSYDIKNKYPSIRDFIPGRLKLIAQAARSEIVSLQKNKHIDTVIGFSDLSENRFFLTNLLDSYYCDQIYQGDMSDGKSLGDKQLIVEYILGATKSSEFSVDLIFPTDQNWNVINIFFSADMGAGITLSNYFELPLTHWFHSYICRPESKKNKLRIEYDSNVNQFEIKWY